MATCNYVSKKIVKEYQKEFEQAIVFVQKQIKKKYKKSFHCMMVGSAKKNLVVTRGNSYYDVDYQCFLSSPAFNKVDAAQLKIFIKDTFVKYFDKNWSVKLSTSVITIIKFDNNGKNLQKSFDVALIKKNPKTKKQEILKGKTGDKKNNAYIKWEELKFSNKILKREKEIEGSKMWKIFHKIFLSKKCQEMMKDKNDQKPTYSIYYETIKETLEYFGK